jgi:putative flippase GtrA
MKKTKKKNLLKLLIQFVKLNLAANILFWGTYAGFAVFDRLLGWEELPALATASILAHILFFIVDKNWVFVDKTGRRKTRDELVKFAIFMGFSYILNIAIIRGLSEYAGISPYIGQFIAAGFFVFWNFIGLRWWVFREMRHQAITVQRSKGERNGGRRTSSK